jgi:hypothetical protein
VASAPDDVEPAPDDEEPAPDGEPIPEDAPKVPEELASTVADDGAGDGAARQLETTTDHATSAKSRPAAKSESKRLDREGFAFAERSPRIGGHIACQGGCRLRILCEFAAPEPVGAKRHEP